MNADERWLGIAVETVTAVLVVAEVVVLFSGIVARYLLHQPLTWSDEVASSLFLWLAMLGAVVALRRGEHMRMTALVLKLDAPVRRWFDTLALVAGLGFLALVALPSFNWASDEAVVVTSALEMFAPTLFSKILRRLASLALSSRFLTQMKTPAEGPCIGRSLVRSL